MLGTHGTYTRRAKSYGLRRGRKRLRKQHVLNPVFSSSLAFYTSSPFLLVHSFFHSSHLMSLFISSFLFSAHVFPSSIFSSTIQPFSRLLASQSSFASQGLGGQRRGPSCGDAVSGGDEVLDLAPPALAPYGGTRRLPSFLPFVLAVGGHMVEGTNSWR